MDDDVEVVIVGAGHAALTVAHDLQRARRDFLIVDGYARIGDAWRRRWDTLRLFTPRRYNELPGLPFPAGDDPFPGKDEVADYQEWYAQERSLPIRTSTFARRISRVNGSFEVALDDATSIRARAAVIATGPHYTPRIPSIRRKLDASVLQLHSSEYRRPAQLPPGPVVVVGASASGTEIAVELSRTHPTILSSGKRWPQAPARYFDPSWWRLAAVRASLQERGIRFPRFLPWPLRPAAQFVKVDLDRAAREHGLRVAERSINAEGTQLRFADGGVAEAASVVWATGFDVDHSWVEIPEVHADPPAQRWRSQYDGLWFVSGGLLFAVALYAHKAARQIEDRLGRRP